MDAINNFLAQFPTISMQDVINIIIAFAILILGWFVAKILGSIISKFIKKSSFVDRMMTKLQVQMDTSKIGDIAGTIIFIIVFAYVLVAFFEFISLPALSEPINNFANALPGYIGVFVLAVVVWLLASFVRVIIRKIGHENNVDEKIGNGTTNSVANAVYGFIILFFLPAILSGLGLNEIVEPVNGIIAQITDYIPNILAAAIILFVGFFIAKLVKQIVNSVLNATRVDSFAERLGLHGVSISNIAGIVAYIVIIIPVAISALDRLGIESVSEPAKRMLSESLLLLPNIIGALILLGLAFIAGRFITGMLEDILKNAGADNVLDKAGIPSEQNISLSRIIANGVFALLMLFAVAEAGNLLGLTIVSDLASDFIEFATLVVGGIITIIIGLIISNIASRAVATSSGNTMIANIVKYAIILLAVAIGLGQMGIADDVITNIFTLIFGSVAVALALAFGIGGRDVAGQQLQKWVNKSENKM